METALTRRRRARARRVRADERPRGHLRSIPSAAIAPTAEATHRPPSWFSADVARVLGASASWGFAFSSFYLLPKFLKTELAAGPAEIGAVVGVAGVSTVIFTILTAGWIDRTPRRYAVAAGALLMGLSGLGFTAVHRIGWLITILRMMQGASYALALTAIGTLIADLVPHQRLSQAFGLSGASMLVMNAIAPAVAEPMANAFGWRTVFLTAAAAGLVSATLALRIHEPASASTAPAAADRGLLAVLRRPLAWHYAAIATVMGATFGVVFTFESPYLLELGATEVRSFFVAYAIAAVTVRVLFGHVPDRYGRHRVAVGGLVAYATAVLAMAYLPAPLFALCGGLFGLAHGLLYPALNAIAVSATPAHERGRILAVFTGSFSLGLWLGPTILGLVAERCGYPTVFVIAAATTLAAAVALACSRALRDGGGAVQTAI